MNINGLISPSNSYQYATPGSVSDDQASTSPPQPEVQRNASPFDSSGGGGGGADAVGAGSQSKDLMSKLAQMLQPLLSGLLGAVPLIGSMLSSLVSGAGSAMGRSTHAT